MVSATDFKPEVKVEKIAEKTFRLTCTACDWMETAGAANAASRKKNRHIAEHMSSTHGTPEIPTIMDALDGVDQVPEVAEPPTPVRDLDYFRKLKEEAAAFIAKHSDDPPAPCPWDCMIQHEHVGPGESPEGEMTVQEVEEALGLEPVQPFISNFCNWCETLHEGGPENCPRPTIGPVGVALNDAEAGDVVAVAVGDFPPRGFELPKTRLELTKARLELQKGPSDRDRDAWMAARADSVSATLAAKLGMAPDLDWTITEQVRLKIEGDPFTGNGYTEWGKHREPFLERAGQERHGIVGESCLFFARANRRHSASPDGIRIHPDTGDVGLGEYKTSGKRLDLAKVHSNGYFYQMQWQMYVMEASHCWLMWEWRHEDPTQPMGFRAEIGGEHLIMRDDEVIEELKRRADLFLDALDLARGKDHAPEGIDPRLKALVNGYLHAKAVVAAAEANLREYCDLNDLKKVVIKDMASVSYSWGSPRTTFDKEAFERDHPGLMESYLKPGKAPEKPTLRVIPVKGDSEDEE